MNTNWSGKPYHGASHFFKTKYGVKLVRVPLNCGFTCPNRDGTKGYGGCAFCSEKGSGDFAGSAELGIAKQFADYTEMISRKWRGCKFMPYFQAFTNTYADSQTLSYLYLEAAAQPDTLAVSIATRPDCLNSEAVKVLAALSEQTDVFVELGLQTANDRLKQELNCLHSNVDYKNACERLNKAGILHIAHIIVGLPGEGREECLESAKLAVSCGAAGLKLSMLHVLEGTTLAERYKRSEFELMDFDDYVVMIIYTICRIPQNIVLHRLTGDGDVRLQLAPKWSIDKRTILNEIDRRMKREGLYQGMYYANSGE